MGSIEELQPVLCEALAKTDCLVRPRYASTAMVRQAIAAGGTRLITALQSAMGKSQTEWRLEFISCPPVVVHVEQRGESEAVVNITADDRWDEFPSLFPNAGDLHKWVRETLAAGPSSLRRRQSLDIAPLAELSGSCGWAAAFSGVSAGDQRILVGLLRATCDSGICPSIDYVRDTIHQTTLRLADWVRVQQCQIGSGWLCFLHALADDEGWPLESEFYHDATQLSRLAIAPDEGRNGDSPATDPASRQCDDSQWTGERVSTFDLRTAIGRSSLFEHLVQHREIVPGRATGWSVDDHDSSVRFLFCEPSDSTLAVVIGTRVGVDEAELEAELKRRYKIWGCIARMHVLFPKMCEWDDEHIQEFGHSRLVRLNAALSTSGNRLFTLRRAPELEIVATRSSFDWIVT